MNAISEVGKRAVRLALPIELTNGNDGRGSKWFSSAKVRIKIEETLRRLGLVFKPLPIPIVIHVTRVLGPGQRLWDYSSGLRGNWKEIEDAAVECGWFHDDGPKWIREVRFFQDSSRRKDGPSIVIEIYQASTSLPDRQGQLGEA